MESVARESGREPWSSGRADVSIRTGAVRMLILIIRMINLHKILLAFQRRQFRPNPIFE
jgi:hypothetical protein